MRILTLRVDNFKRLIEWSIEPEPGKPVVLTGPNGVGKSSALQAVEAALCNTELTNPIHNGADKCVIRLGIGEDAVTYTVRRCYTKAGGHALEVKDDLGRQVPSPQQFLDGLVGNLCFDPLEFLRMKPKDQAETLKAICGLDFSDLETRRRNLYAERTVANRQKKAVEAQFNALPAPSPETPDAEVSAAEILSRIDSLGAEMRECEDVLAQAEHLDNAVLELENQIREAQRRLDELKELQTAVRDAAKEAGTRYAHAKESQGKAKADLVGIESVNSLVRAKAAYATKRGELKRAIAEADRLDKAIEDIDAEKAGRIAAAKLPISGMEIGEDGVLVNGLPFAQLSTGEQIRVSAALAMSQNPKLKVMLVREASFLDSNNLATLYRVAEEAGFQLWVERVAESPGEGIWMVDAAAVASDNEQALP